MTIDVVVISHALAVPSNQERWQMLSKLGRKVAIVYPRKWRSRWFGKPEVYQSSSKAPELYNFQRIPLNTLGTENWNNFLFFGLFRELARLKPRFVYVVQNETCFVHLQVLMARLLLRNKFKYLFFSMNASGLVHHRKPLGIKWFLLLIIFKALQNFSDGAFVHYPGCRVSLLAGGFRKPVRLQTQIGVHSSFRYRSTVRNQSRLDLGIGDNAFVLGYVGRLVEEKGVWKVANIFQEIISQGYSQCLLMIVGEGPEKQALQNFFIKNSLADRVMFIGQVSHLQVAHYTRTFDVSYVLSQDTETWVDTFPLALAQSLSCGVPVIASNAGAIPFMLSNGGGLAIASDNEVISKAVGLTAQWINDSRSHRCVAKKAIKASRQFRTQNLAREFANFIDHD